jgi:hypothetical protein
LHKNYKVFQAIIDQSGFGWDDVEKIPIAPDEVWAAYIEVSLISSFLIRNTQLLDDIDI